MSNLTLAATLICSWAIDSKSMSLLLDTILQVVDLVQKAIEIYHRVEGLSKQMLELGRRLEKINVFLGMLEGFVRNKPATVYDGLFAGQKEEAAAHRRWDQENAGKARDLFDRYEKGILSRGHDLTFRLKWPRRYGSRSSTAAPTR